MLRLAFFLGFALSAHVLKGDFGHNDYGCSFWLLNFFRRDGPFTVHRLIWAFSIAGWSIFVAPFTLLSLEAQGLRGVREHDPKKLWTFYLWKLGRFCFESMLLFTDMFESTE
jgi:hypothetical protein